MGKKDNDSAEQPDSENKKSSEENKIEEKPEEIEEKKEDAEKLRKVIKVDEKKEEEQKEEKEQKKEVKEEKDQEKEEETSVKTEASSEEGIEGLEQKRAVLQSIKDFDFQIKKNQEEITGINKKVDSVSKDLDDLVSLYEIVSEQMNPFVGLSKVTKKRIDALENFTREIETLKERTGELESFAERSGAKLKSIAEGKVKADTIDTDELLKDTDIDEKDKTDNTEEDSIDNKEKIEDDIPNEPEKIKEITKDDIEKKDAEIPKSEIESIKENDTKEVQINNDVKKINDKNKFWKVFSDDEIDKIIEMSLDNLSVNDKIDMVIDDFIEKLKG